MRPLIKNVRRKLEDKANNPTYIFNQPHIGYRMDKGEGQVAQSASGGIPSPSFLRALSVLLDKLNRTTGVDYLTLSFLYQRLGNKQPN